MRDDRYEIRGKLGQGGVGSVYRAFDTQLNREVAIKRVLAEGGHEDQEEATKSLLKEASALSSLQHPHIVTIYDAGVDDDGPYVIMELIDGRTLDEMVEEGVLTWEDLREIILQSQEGLIAAQDLDLVHRDLKPSNLMICWLPSGKFQVKIVDFGLAKFSATPSLQTIEHGDSVFGSIFFMAPEQFERTPLDKRTDIYALGCLYYYALTGQHPFTGESPAEVMISHLQHHVTPLSELRPDIPKWGADWIMWHMERQMDGRPGDAREALERFLFLEKNPTQAVKLTSPVKISEGNKTGTPKLLTPGLDTGTASTPAAPSQPLRTASSPVPVAKPATSAIPAATPVARQALPVTPATPAKPASPMAASPAPAVAPAQPGEPPVLTPAQAPVTVPLKARKPTPVATATPVHRAPDDSGLGFESAKKTMPAGAKWAIISMLIVFITVTAIVGTSILDERKYTQMVNDVMVRAKALDDEGKLETEGIELSEEELRGTLERATSMAEDKQRAILLKTLRSAKAAGGYDADAIILNHSLTAKCPPSIRAGLFQDVIKWRGNPKSIEPLLKFAKESGAEDAAVGAIFAARSCAVGQQADAYITDLLYLIKASDSIKVRGAAERAALTIIEQSENKAALEPDIYDLFKNDGNEEVKLTMIRLLGATGEDMALDAIDEAIKSETIGRKSAAVAALAKWKDDSQFPRLISFIKGEKDKDLRANAFDQALTFLGQERQRESDQLQGLWKSVAGLAATPRDKQKIIAGLASQTNPWAITMLQSYRNDPDDNVNYAAERAIEWIERNKSKGNQEGEDQEEGSEDG